MTIPDNLKNSNIIEMAAEVIRLSCVEPKMSIFVEKMFEMINMYVDFSSGIVNFCLINKKNVLSELRSYLYNQPEKIQYNYEKNFSVDFFTPHLILAPKTPLVGSDYVGLSTIEDTPYYIQHLRHFDIGNGLGVAFPFPGHYGKWIMFYILKSQLGNPFQVKDKVLIDRISDIIYIILLHKAGLICRNTMEKHALLRLKFINSPKQLRLLKLLIGNPSAKSHEYAHTMSISPRTIEHQLDIIYDKIGVSRDSKNKKMEALQLLQIFNW